MIFIYAFKSTSKANMLCMLNLYLYMYIFIIYEALSILKALLHLDCCILAPYHTL